MTSAFIKQLKDAIEDINELDLAKIKQLTQESAHLIHDLHDMMDSGDAAMQSQAAADVSVLKQFIETQMARVVDKSGMSLEDFLATMTSDTLSAENNESYKVLQDFEEGNNKKRNKKIKPRIS